jgi:DNA/RNA-binding domain of Phe-tRNA-synthetase-like protein
MIISINKKVFRKFAKLKIILFKIKDFDNKSQLKESKLLLKDIETYTRLTFNKDTIKTHYLISPLNVAKADFGRNAKHYHTSVEKLLQNVLKKKRVSTNNVISNIFRYLSLKHIVPYALDDFDKIEGDLKFSLANGKEKIKWLNKLEKNNLFYGDEKRVIGVKFDHWKNPYNKVTATTNKVLGNFLALPPTSQKVINDLIKDAKSLIKTFCNASVDVYILDNNNSSIELSRSK